MEEAMLSGIDSNSRGDHFRSIPWWQRPISSLNTTLVNKDSIDDITHPSSLGIIVCLGLRTSGDTHSPIFLQLAYPFSQVLLVCAAISRDPVLVTSLTDQTFDKYLEIQRGLQLGENLIPL